VRVLAFLQAKLVCCPLSGPSELGALLLEFFGTTPESYANGYLLQSPSQDLACRVDYEGWIEVLSTYILNTQ